MKNQDLKLFFALVALEGFFVSVIYYGQRLTPGEHFLQTGFPLKTLLLFSGMVLLSFLCLGCYVFADQNPARTTRILRNIITEPFQKGAILFFFFLFLESTQNVIHVFSPAVKPLLFFDYQQRLLVSLLPVFFLGMLISIQGLWIIFVKVNRSGSHPFSIFRKNPRRIFLSIVLIALWMGLTLTEFGYIPGTSNRLFRKQVGRFLPLAAPLPGAQVLVTLLLVVLVGILILKLSGRWAWFEKLTGSPWIAGLAIWFIALVFWLSVPIESNYLIDIPEYPAGAIYPNSDAVFFDRDAHRFLAGVGFVKESTHVMYSFFLTGLQLLIGSRYQDLYLLQALVLALTPVLIYYFVRELHSRAAGITAALFFILRERNALQLSTELAGPAVSQFMSENLALLVLIGYLYLVHRWLLEPEKKAYLPAIAGGVMGVILLIRAEVLSVLIAVGAISLVLLWKQKGIWLSGMIKMFLITAVIITPWMVRNYQQTGIFTLDKGDFISRRVSAYLENLRDREQIEAPEALQESGETPDFSGKLNVLANHIGNNTLQSFLYLPNNHQPIFGADQLLFKSGRSEGHQLLELLPNYFSEEYLNIQIRSLPYYWFSWNGRISALSIVPVLMVSLLIALGGAAIWRQHPRTLLVLLTAGFAQVLIWAFAGKTGNRFVKLTDWIPLILFAAGSLEGFSVAARWFYNRNAGILSYIEGISKPDLGANLGSLPKGIWRTLPVLTLVILGWGPPLLEAVIPPRYTQARLTEILTENTINGRVSPSTIRECSTSPDLGQEISLAYGRALYPRYFKADEVLDNNRRHTMFFSSYPRYDFYLVGTSNQGVSIPELDPTMGFPHVSEVIVIGPEITPMRRTFIQAQCIFIVDSTHQGEIDQVINCTGASCVME